MALWRAPLAQLVVDTDGKTIPRAVVVNVRDPDDNRPLHLAAEKGYTDCVRYLIRNGANLNQLNNAGYTPLHLAVINNFDETAQVLLENRADPYIAKAHSSASSQDGSVGALGYAWQQARLQKLAAANRHAKGGFPVGTQVEARSSFNRPWQAAVIDAVLDNRMYRVVFEGDSLSSSDPLAATNIRERKHGMSKNVSIGGWVSGWASGRASRAGGLQSWQRSGRLRLGRCVCPTPGYSARLWPADGEAAQVPHGR